MRENETYENFQRQRKREGAQRVAGAQTQKESVSRGWEPGGWREANISLLFFSHSPRKFRSFLSLSGRNKICDWSRKKAKFLAVRRRRSCEGAVLQRGSLGKHEKFSLAHHMKNEEKSKMKKWKNKKHPKNQKEDKNNPKNKKEVKQTKKVGKFIKNSKCSK